jgi:hypothetical protein
MGACLGVACAQTPASQQNESQWKQTPEGRSPGVPGQQQPMNCSGSITSGDGKVEKISNCPAPNAQPQAPTNASQQFPYPGDSTGNPTPATPGAKQTPGSAGQAPASKQFPYPGDDAGGSSSSAAKPAPPAGDGLQDAGSSGASSGSSSSSSSSAGPDNGADGDAGTVAPVRVRRRRVPAAPRLTPTQRETEDLQVAGFYQNDGDFRGAYLRAKDAVSIAESDPDAHLALGEAARKLGKLDEAEQNYRRCLQLDPVPKSRKTAERALKEMTGGG